MTTSLAFGYGSLAVFQFRTAVASLSEEITSIGDQGQVALGLGFPTIYSIGGFHLD